MTHTIDEPTAALAYPPAMLAGSPEGLAELSVMLGAAITAARCAERPGGPLPAGPPDEVMAAAGRALGTGQIPEQGIGAETALARVAKVLVEQGLDLAHPHTAAHLQAPVLAVAVAADALASMGNASLDTFDSGPSAIAVERWLVRGLATMARLGDRADGVCTPGGSMSNLLALLLARDAAAERRGIDARHEGVARLPSPVVFCSEIAHFSVHRAAAALGLGENVVLPVPADAQHRMRADALAAAVRGLGPDRTPVAVVGTAGTTDFGTVDPLHAMAEICGEHGIWLHVDAAYGFGTLFSDRLAGLLDGIELADSITADLHKLGWLPAAASVLLVSDIGAFGALDRTVGYLNPVDDQHAGYDGLLGRSLQTTRRPDAVKAAATLLAYGRAGVGAMVDACHDLAVHAAERIEAEPELVLVSPVTLSTVVFRYVGVAATSCTPERRGHPLQDVAANRLNAGLRRRLLDTGAALIGRTEVRQGPGPCVCLKFTLLNPTATRADIDRLVDVVLAAGRAEDRLLKEEGAA